MDFNIKSESTPWNNNPFRNDNALIPAALKPVFLPLLLPRPAPFLHILPAGDEKSENKLLSFLLQLWYNKAVKTTKTMLLGRLNTYCYV